MRHIRLILAVILALGPLSANADFIVGAITMSGDFAPTGGTDLGDATGLDFLGDDFLVDGATGDFAASGIGPGDTGFLQDFDFSPLGPNPVNPLWAIGGFEFSLQSISVVYQTTFFIVLSGEGTLSGGEFDDTPGSWSLTGNSAGLIFNYSAGGVAIA